MLFLKIFDIENLINGNSKSKTCLQVKKLDKKKNYFELQAPNLSRKSQNRSRGIVSRKFSMLLLVPLES
jgi:hypothetical protein